MKAAEQGTLQPGTQLGPYTILRLIAVGGMGEVYQAREDRLERDVALKIMAPKPQGQTDPEFLSRFINEGKTLALANHPNLVSIYAVDQINGIHFIAMEYVEGVALSTIIQNFTLESRDAAVLFEQMLNGLEALHSKNIIHRDLKPQNIIYQKDNLIKIVDLGIAKVYGEKVAHNTSTGFIVGTVQFLSPEVAHGRPATKASDIWSMGAIFYEMVTGIPLLPSGTPMKVLSALTTLKVEFPKEAKTWIAPEIQTIIKKMCARDLQDRYKTVPSVLMDLKKYMATHPAGDKWQYQYIGKNIVNNREIRGTLLRNGHSTSTAKRVALEALSQDMEAQSMMAVTGDETVALNLSDSIKISPSAVQRALASQKTAIRWKMPKVTARHALRFILFVISLIGAWSTINRLRPEERAKLQELVKNTVQGKPTASLLSEPPAPPAPVPANSPPESAPPPPPQAPTAKEPMNPAPPTALALVNPHSEFTLKFSETRRSPSSSTPRPVAVPIFEWRQIIGTEAYEIQISDRENFSHLIVNQKTPSSFYSWFEAQPGRYFWRVRSIGEKGTVLVTSSMGEIRVKLPAPQLSNNTSSWQDDGKGGAAVSVSWTPAPLYKTYRLLASADPDFKTKIVNEVVPSNQRRLALPPGRYFIKVAVVNGDGQEASDYSEPAAISLASTEGLRTPTLIAPPNQATLNLAKAGGDKLILFWSKSVDAQSYEVQISAKADFSEISESKTTKENKLTINHPFQSGIHYWRVRAVKDQANSPWSYSRAFVSAGI